MQRVPLAAHVPRDRAKERERGRERGAKEVCHTKITRAARLAPVIKLTVKIGEKRGNNGQTPGGGGEAEEEEEEDRANRGYPVNDSR